MAQLPGYSGIKRITTLDFSGTIAAGGTSQLLLPYQPTRSYFLFQNISDTAMYLGVGAPTATASLSSGKVSSVSVVNGGFGFTYPPKVKFYGGSVAVVGPADSLGSQWGNAPADAAVAVANLSGNAVNTITVQNGGSGYLVAPYVYLEQDPRDPFGCTNPSATSGIQINAGGSYIMDASTVTTDPIAVFCATISKAFTCKVVL